MEKSLKNIDDAYKWSRETVELLRAGDFSRIDMDELVNEIGSIASGLHLELRSGFAVYLGRIPGSAQTARDLHQYGWPRSRAGQCFHRTVVALAQVPSIENLRV